MRPIIALSLSVLLCTSACAVRLGHSGHATKRAVVVTLDGAGERIVEAMLAQGHMPNLARLKARGVWPDYSRTNFPSKTAAGHAALWTGAMSDVNGITSNRVFRMPRHAHTITEVTDGFSSENLLAEPIWVTAARAGKRAVVVQATHVAPVSTYEPGGRWGGPFPGSLTLLDGYAGEMGQDAVYNDSLNWRPASGWTDPIPGPEPMEHAIKLDERNWWALAFDDPDDPTVGYDTLALAPHKAGSRTLLKVGDWTEGLRLDTARGRAYTTFHLFDLHPQLASWSLYRSGVAMGVSNHPEAAETWYGKDTPFFPQGPAKLWSKGAFGRTLFEAGDGVAERRYLGVVQHITSLARRRLEKLLQRQDWELGVYYLPFPDEALHQMYGAVDPTSPSRDELHSAATERQLAQVCRAVDGALAPLADAEDTVVAIASDHGMAGLKWNFSPNFVLRQAGLLALDRQGQVDLKRTRALYPDTDGGFVVLNHRRYKGGIVTASETETVLKQVEAAFASARDAQGNPIVVRTLRGSGAEAQSLGIGGPRSGDLYLDLAPGYYFDAALEARALVSPQPFGRGGHIFDPRRADMHAFMVLAGPGLKRGVEIPAVTNADLAPTLCRLLGIPKPAHATGAVIEAGLTPTE
ncbi:MAG: alkaline phosphatase family protein [Candidatus Sericytochromatia bacterium]|nr:alkaline phosphatase family protein [Candidatus Sericytochromatia bacterium]